MLPKFLVLCCLILFGIVLKRYDSDPILRMLYKKLILLYQCLDFEDSKPSSSYIFSVEDFLMTPVLASVVLY